MEEKKIIQPQSKTDGDKPLNEEKLKNVTGGSADGVNKPTETFICPKCKKPIVPGWKHICTITEIR